MRYPLEIGAYSARSVICSAQRCCNLYAEKSPKTSPTTFTYYPAPGLRALATPPVAGIARCLYRSNAFGDLYGVIGSNVYWIDSSWAFHLLGTITPNRTNICYMADNGTTIVLVDGSPNGWQIDMTTRVMTQITAATNAPAPGTGIYEFNGGVRVDCQDGYVMVNDPGSTRNFRTTYLNQIIWDSLWFAAKNGFSDNLVTIAVQKREIWLIGEKTTEIWFQAGLSPGIPFALMPGPFIQQGCWAPYSIACADGIIYFLSQDQTGKNVLLAGLGYKVVEVSTQAQVTEWSTYSRTDDAIGFLFQQNDHVFYQITFPSADKTWRYDRSTEQWHEAVWTDDNGGEHRHRANVCAFAYGQNVVGDWETGKLYALDPYVYTDDERTMYWRRGFPHLVNDGNRMIYPGFVLDLDAGEAVITATTTSGLPLLDEHGAPILVPPLGTALLVGPVTIAGTTSPYTRELFDLPMRINDPNLTSLGLIGRPRSDGSPKVWLRWSDDRGRTWRNPISQSMGGTGQYNAQAQWSRTGMARDRVFEVFGAIPGSFAINGAWLDPQPIPLKS